MSTVATPGIDAPRVTDWLAGCVPGLEPPLAFTRVGEGQSNLTFRVDDAAGRAVVVRRPPLGEILASAHDVAREYRVLTSLASAGGRVPRTYALCTDLDVTGAPFYAMEHVDGLILTRTETAERLAPEVRARVATALAETLAALHSVDVDVVGLADFKRPESLISRQLRRWRRQWEASRTRALPAIDEVGELLAARMPEERETVLLHGDYHLHNIVLGDDGGVRVNAIAPGFFPSEMTAELIGDEGSQRFFERRVPMRRPGRADELDGVLLFLATDASSYCTGQVITIDGGWTIR